MSDWQWLNADLIDIGLDGEPAEVIDEVLAALESARQRPYEPFGAYVHQMR